MTRTAVLSPATGIVGASDTPQNTEKFRSLAECAVESDKLAYAATGLDRDGDVSLPDLYDRLLEKHVGTRNYRRGRDDQKIVTVMNSVERFCKERDLDLPLYVAAQMAMLKDFVTRPFPGRKRALGFQPTMLLGPKAIGRYNTFVRRTDRQYHRVSEDVLRSQESAMRDILTRDEVSVGAYYCAAALQGEPVAWLESARRSDPSVCWWAVRVGLNAPDPIARVEFGTLAGRHGLERLARIAYAATCAAAVTVCDRYHSGLSARFAVRVGSRVTWEALAAAIVRARPQPRVSAKVSRGLRAPGILYAPGG